jgi:hypothetical protein
MGKIGDLWVRLGLKNDEFTKGIDKSKKKTEELQQPIGKVKGAFEGMKAGALAVWAAIGASVVAFGKELISTTNRIGDAWQSFTAQAKAGWTTFVQAISNFEFDGLIGNIKEATAAAKELQSALDFEFEASNSIKIQKSQMAEELEMLRIAARDQTKTQKERLAAADEYMRKMSSISEQEIQLANELLDAWQGKWLAGSKLTDNKGTRDDLMRFLVDYGKDRQLAAQLAQYLALNKDIDSWNKMAKGAMAYGNAETMRQGKAKVAEYDALKNWLTNYGKNNGYNNFIGDLADVYENWRGDADTQPLVDALINAGNARANLSKETRQMQTLRNSILAQLEDVAAQMEGINTETETTLSEAEQLAQDVARMREEMAANPLPTITPPDIFTDDWLTRQTGQLKSLTQSVEETTTEMNEMLLDFSGIIVDSMASGIQAMTDAMFGLNDSGMKGVIAAFIAPFGDGLKQMGAGIAAYGTAMAAFKVSWSSPGQAIAAGAALMAIGSIISSGAQALAANPAGGMSGGSSMSYGGASIPEVQSYESTLTVEVVGHISGSDIVLAGKKTQDKWRR